MKRTNFILTFLLSVLIFACSTQPAVKLPVAEKIPHDVFDKRMLLRLMNRLRRLLNILMMKMNTPKLF